MAEGSRSEAKNAETCLGLAEAALTSGRDDDLARAAEAAISLCKFVEAKKAIDAMPAGARKTALAARYEAAVGRESATDAMFQEARALFKSGDMKAALAKLAQARANTLCSDYAAKIDATTAHIQSLVGGQIAQSVRAAIAQCRFEEARALLDGADAATELELPQLRAEYQSAYEREKETNALWQQAGAMRTSGRPKEALALLRQARSHTRCPAHGAQIDAAIAQLSQPGGETEVSGWQTAWRGNLKMQRILVNGSPVELATLFAMIDSDWRAEKARDAGGRDSVSGIFKGLKSEVGDIVVGVVKTLVAVIDEGIGWGFEMRPEGNGLRLSVIGADKAATDINKSLSQLPPFTVESERQVTLAHRAAENGAAVRATIAVDEAWNQATLTAVITSALAPGEETQMRSIRSVELTFGGTFEPGELPAAEIQDELARKMAAAQRRYLPAARKLP